MDIAMEQSIAATTVFGRKAESSVAARNQTAICCFTEVPTRLSIMDATRLSTPVRSQAMVMRFAPARRNPSSAA